MKMKYISVSTFFLCLPVQVLSDSHSGVLKLAAGFSDSLFSLQRETESLKRLKSDLQRDNKGEGLNYDHYLCSQLTYTSPEIQP